MILPDRQSAQTEIQTHSDLLTDPVAARKRVMTEQDDLKKE